MKSKREIEHEDESTVILQNLSNCLSFIWHNVTEYLNLLLVGLFFEEWVVEAALMVLSDRRD